MIRFLLVFIFLFFFFLFSLISLPIEWLIGKVSKQTKDIRSLRIVQGAFKIILFLSGVKTTVIGAENIPESEPVLYIGNHRGFYDVIVSYTLMKGATGFVAKKEMHNVLIVRKWMKNLYCLFLDRDNIKEGLKTILQGIDYIKDGKSIVIFPEGTRNKGEGVQEFHAGSFKFAEKTGCKIIPMVQNNTEAVFENQLPFLKSAHTVIEFGKPIDLNTLSKEERKNIASYTHDIIEKMYEKNQALV